MRISKVIIALALPVVVAGGCGGTVHGIASNGGTGAGGAAEDGGAGAGNGGTGGQTDAGSGGAAGGGAAGADGDGGVGPGASGCAPLNVARGTNLSGYTSDLFSFSDAACEPRSAALVRNTAADPGGGFGGYLRQLSYRTGGVTRTCRGTGANGWQGLGYVVAHYGNTAAASNGTPGTYRTVLAGRHHAIHEFKWRLNMGGGSVDVTAHWLIATGRSHPLYSITLDSTPAGPDAVLADSRSPYGDIAWDGTPGDVSGVGWGDRYRFRSTGSGPLTMSSSWDYTQPNVVPHALEWSTGANAEIGLVLTQAFDTQVGGGEYGPELARDCWGKTSANRGSACSADGETMPQAWLWPFQLNQYELPYTTQSHRVAWGLNYGAVGQTSYRAFGRDLSGYPYQSYSLYVVFGEHRNSAVEAQLSEVASTVRSRLSASVGTVASSGPAGIARSDRVSYTPAGYNAVYGVWEVSASSNRASMQLAAAGATRLVNPMLRVLAYESSNPPAAVRLNGRTLRADQDYFASIDSATRTLWLTLNASLSGTITIEVT